MDSKYTETDVPRILYLQPRQSAEAKKGTSPGGFWGNPAPVSFFVTTATWQSFLKLNLNKALEITFAHR